MLQYQLRIKLELSTIRKQVTKMYLECLFKILATSSQISSGIASPKWAVQQRCYRVGRTLGLHLDICTISLQNAFLVKVIFLSITITFPAVLGKKNTFPPIWGRISNFLHIAAYLTNCTTTTWGRIAFLHVTWCLFTYVICHDNLVDYTS